MRSAEQNSPLGNTKSLIQSQKLPLLWVELTLIHTEQHDHADGPTWGATRPKT